MPKEYLSSKQAAKYVGWSASNLNKKRCVGGDQPPYIQIGRTVRYDRDDLDAWMAKNRKEGSAVVVKPYEYGHSEYRHVPRINPVIDSDFD